MKNHSLKVGDMVMPRLGVTSSNNNVGVENVVQAEIKRIYDQQITIQVVEGHIVYQGTIYPQHYN